MANVNKVMLIGRLTRDPETRTFTNGGKVVQIGFAVTNRKKNQSTGEWEDDPMFIDLKLFSRGENSRQVDLAEESLRKGSQIFVEGRLVLEKWESEGQKRSKHVIYVENFQFLDPKTDGGSSRSYGSSGSNYSGGSRSRPAASDDFDDADMPSNVAPSAAPEDDIPF